MENTLNVDTPTHYAVNSPSLHSNFPKPWHICFSTILLFMDLQSSWRKGVLYWSGYWDHLFVSQAYGWWAIVPKPSQTLFFGNVIFGCLASNFRATSENNAVWNSDSFFVRDTYLGILPMRARWWSFFLREKGLLQPWDLCSQDVTWYEVKYVHGVLTLATQPWKLENLRRSIDERISQVGNSHGVMRPEHII